MSITKIDNFNVSGYQLTSELFSDDTPSVSCMCVGSNIRAAGKSSVGGGIYIYFSQVHLEETQRHANLKFQTSKNTHSFPALVFVSFT